MESLILEKLKRLTPEQCVEIANLYRNDVNWRIRKGAYNGFTLIDSFGYIMQIDLRPNIGNKWRISYFQECDEIVAVNDNIVDYILTI